jgi:hypothetical protein
VVMNMQCQATKKDGKPCSAKAMQGKKQCFMHSPACKQRRLIAQRNGGLARKHTKCYISEEIKLESPKDIQKLIEVTLNSLLKGKMPAKSPASHVAYLSNTWLSAYEKGELVERIDRLEGLVQKAINEN